MNERIKELYVHATEYANHQTTFDPRTEFAEKFAELIIANCTECVRDVLRDATTTLSYEDASKIQNRIKEYFGVEE